MSKLLRSAFHKRTKTYFEGFRSSSLSYHWLGAQALKGPVPQLRNSIMEYTATTALSRQTSASSLNSVAQLEVSSATLIAVKEKKGRKSKYARRKELAIKATQAKETQVTEKPKVEQTPKRQAPSQASGGVPDPTPAYLDQALGKPYELPSPRRILLILDLNGTMLFRPIKKRPFHFIERPHAQDFLAYCLDTFYVAIWSSARPANVSKMVEKLLTPDQVRRCTVVWARDRFDLSAEDYNSRVQCYKRLTRIWDDPVVRASHPHGGRWDQTNTVLIDDSLEKGRSEPYNILPIPEFSGLAHETAEVLPQVHDYLNTLCWQGNISRYMRHAPFALDPHYKLHQGRGDEN